MNNSFQQKFMCGYEVFISENSMHVSLIAWVKRTFKRLYTIFKCHTSLSHVENSRTIIYQYRD